MNGRKNDAEKTRWDLVPWRAVAAIADVLTFGARKYGPENWKKLPDARARYSAAMLRHFTAWSEGERNDPESGLHHLAHAGCSLLFLLWLDLRVSGFAAPMTSNEVADPEDDL